MSRFFTQVSSSSESESESDREEEPVQVRKRVAPAAKKQNKFESIFSEDEEEEKRTVKSAKDKRYDELKTTIKKLKNYKKVNDFTSVLSEFVELTTTFDKSKTTLARAGDEIPSFYIKCISDLEDFMTTSWEDKELRSRLNKLNGKSLATLRQKIRKYNKDYENEIKEYRENPFESGPEDEADADQEMDSDADDIGPGFTSKDVGEIGRKQFADDFDDDDDWSHSESSDDESLSSIELEKEGENLVFKNIAQYFLKKDTSEKVQTKESTKEREERKLARKKKREEERLNRQKRDDEFADAKEKPKLFPKDSEVSFDMMMKKFAEIISARGKKGTDKFEQIQTLAELLDITVASNLGEGVRCKIFFSLISAVFDLNTNIFESMKHKHWLTALEHLEKLAELLFENIGVLKTNVNYTDEEEVLKKPEKGEVADEDGSIYKVRGCLLTMVDRLSSEFTKILQDSDCHSTDYVEKLRCEPRLYALTVRCQSYLEKCKSTPDLLCKSYLSRLELLYYKFDPHSVSDAETTEGKELGGLNSAQVVDKLCKYIYTNDKTNWIRTRAVLCQIFHLALHDKWFMARDLMLMSHLQESIQFADVETQLLYNRTLVQLGLCAFRHGNIRAAHDALLDIQSSGRKKEQELLAQGLVNRSQQEKTAEQEKVERRRQQAFHTHINLDLLECVYLVSAMLLEIPYMASHESDTKRRMISKSFHNQLKQSERQPLPGPPENMHEHVIAASKAMRMGDWQNCYKFIVNPKMNSRVWDLFPRPDSVKQILKRKIQEESLRAYLFTFSSKFSTISLDNLAELFQLEKHVVHSIISKLIITEELSASWDEPSNCIVTHPSDPSLVQKLCNQLAEKLNHLVENNERLLESIGNKNLHYMFQTSSRDNKGEGRQDMRGKNQGQRMRPNLG